MPYSIRMADGTVIPGIPDDQDPGAFIEQYEADKAANAPGEGLETFKAGVGRGAVNIARNIGSLVGMVSEEELEEAARLDQPLMETTSGMLGSVAGEIATTAPVGIAAATGRHALARAIQARPYTAGALGGAAEGYLASTPGERGMSTALGAVGGTGGVALGRAIGKIRGGRLDPDVEDYISHHPEMRGVLPLSVLAQKGTLTKRMMEDILPSLPGGGRHVKRSQQAHQAARKLIHETAAPRADLAPTDLKGVGRTDIEELRKAHDEVYEDMNRWEPEPGIVLDQPVALPDPSPLRVLIEDLPKQEGDLKQLLLRKVNDGTFSVDDLMKLRQQYIFSFTGSRQFESDRMKLRKLDRIIDEEIKPFLSNEVKDRMDDLLSGQTSKATRLGILEEAVRAAPQGEYSIQALAQTAAQRASRRTGAAGSGALQVEADMAAKALGKEMQEPGFWRNVATFGLAYGAAGVGGGLPGILAAVGGQALNMATASRLVSRAFAGDFGAQKRIAKLVEDNPEVAQRIMALLATSGAAATGDQGA